MFRWFEGSSCSFRVIAHSINRSPNLSRGVVRGEGVDFKSGANPRNITPYYRGKQVLPVNRKSNSVPCYRSEMMVWCSFTQRRIAEFVSSLSV